jgi:hypothetical protein
MGEGALAVNAVIVLAPGQSLAADVVDRVRGIAPVIAVTEAFKIAPWCEVLVANDRSWWAARPEAKELPCTKYSTRRIEGVEQIESNATITGGSSSGVLALWVAMTLGAKRILMLGFDNKGTHFNGPYEGKLQNTQPVRFAVFECQFRELAVLLKKSGVDVVNCTPGTALKAFRTAPLDEGLAWLTS